MKNIHNFENQQQFNDYRYSNKYIEPSVSLIQNGNKLEYNDLSDEYWTNQPLTFEILSDGNILWKNISNANALSIDYKINNGNWTSITSTTSGTIINVSSGDILQFIGNNSSYGTATNKYCYFASTANFLAKGNIMSLINSANFSNLTVLSTYYTFTHLFTDCKNLIDAGKLILPALELSGYCYANMFESCTNLVNAPKLPATTLATFCYSTMFSSCTSLINAPELPATTLATYCYRYMFNNCDSLTIAPTLPATSLKTMCYDSMFFGANNIKYIKAMFTTTPSTSYTNTWVSGVASTGTFVKNSAATWNVTGVHGIPSGWTVETATA